MPRPKRITTPGVTHHVYCRCIEKKSLLRTPFASGLLIRILRKTQEKYTFDMVAYQIMDNHFHFIIKTKAKRGIHLDNHPVYKSALRGKLQQGAWKKRTVLERTVQGYRNRVVGQARRLPAMAALVSGLQSCSKKPGVQSACLSLRQHQELSRGRV